MREENEWIWIYFCNYHMTTKPFIRICSIEADEHERDILNVIVVSCWAAHRSFKVVECEFDLSNLSIVQFDLLSEIHELLVLLLSTTRLFLLFAMVCKLVDLQGVIEVLGINSLFLETRDLAGANLEAIVSDTGVLCGCCCLHFSYLVININYKFQQNN